MILSIWLLLFIYIIMKEKDRVLKKCPFCGGYARFGEDMRFHEKSQNFPKWYVLCNDCGIRTETATIPLVMKMWNQRTVI